jgi:hypothetical protein
MRSTPKVDNPLVTINRLSSPHDNERGFIVDWLVRLAIWFVIVAVVLFDGGSILINFFTLDSTADEIAVQVTTDALASSMRVETVQPQAAELAAAAGAELVGVRVEGNIVYISLRREADTLVIGRIGWIEDWARATVEGQAGFGPQS